MSQLHKHSEKQPNLSLNFNNATFYLKDFLEWKTNFERENQLSFGL